MGSFVAERCFLCIGDVAEVDVESMAGMFANEAETGSTSRAGSIEDEDEDEEDVDEDEDADRELLDDFELVVLDEDEYEEEVDVVDDEHVEHFELLELDEPL